MRFGFPKPMPGNCDNFCRLILSCSSLMLTLSLRQAARSSASLAPSAIFFSSRSLFSRPRLASSCSLWARCSLVSPCSPGSLSSSLLSTL